jgi:tetratricopeptide (TPR) repeat protein
MEIALNSSPRKTLIVGAGVALFFCYAVLAARLFIASEFAGNADLASLQQAVRFDPDNADYRDHLGRYYALVARDPGSAIAPYRSAVSFNPHSARYWFDLASAYQVLGDVSNQTWALQHAIEADPTTPDVAWEAANFYLVQGDEAKALREFRVVLENDPSLADLAIQYCWRVKPDVDELLRNVVPAKSEAYFAFLTLLMTKQETAATKKVWAALISSGESFELRRVFEYFQFLIN